MPSGPLARQALRVATATATAALATGIALQRRAGAGRAVPLTLPSWVLPTDVLGALPDAERHARATDETGLPFVVDDVEAWAAAGALAALVRLVDDGSRSSTVVVLGGRRAPLARWCRWAGYRVLRTLPAEPGAADLVARVHPADVVAEDVEELLPRAAVALRPGGALVVTLPVGDADADGALGRADLRALAARADDLGLRLVGDLDGELGRRLARTVLEAREDESGRPRGSAYGLARLTFRRR